MLLAVNIGNSNIRFGVFKSEKEIITWTINTKPYRTEDEFFAKFNNIYDPFGLNKEDITGIVIGSVVPHLTQLIRIALEKTLNLKPMIVDRNTPSNIKHHSIQMGTDLYANAVAAQELYKNKKKIVIDFGTALTFMGVDENGNSLGVSIAPGVVTSLNSLIENTAQLPDIDLKQPESVLGFDTESCMQSGIIFGFTAMVEGIIDRIKKEFGEDIYVVATGGLGFIFSPLIKSIDTHDVLHTLKGLVLLYKMNSADK